MAISLARSLALAGARTRASFSNVAAHSTPVCRPLRIENRAKWWHFNQYTCTWDFQNSVNVAYRACFLCDDVSLGAYYGVLQAIFRISLSAFSSFPAPVVLDQFVPTCFTLIIRLFALIRKRAFVYEFAWPGTNTRAKHSRCTSALVGRTFEFFVFPFRCWCLRSPSTRHRPSTQQQCVCAFVLPSAPSILPGGWVAPRQFVCRRRPTAQLCVRTQVRHIPKHRKR